MQIPSAEDVARALERFTFRERLCALACVVVFIGSVIGLLGIANAEFMTEVPAHGGALSEGIIGGASLINPILDVTDADRDLVSLVYSGMMRLSPRGEIEPDLAERYTLSEDGLKYTFTMRDNLTFHDGYALTSEDVAFTIGLAKDPISTRRAQWDGVDVSTPDLRTVVLTLKKPFKPFIYNTTLGILPKRIWGSVKAKDLHLARWNIEPIGSGPYKISEVERDKENIPTAYNLKSFRKFSAGEPFIEKLVIKLYPNEEKRYGAFARGDVDVIGSVAPDSVKNLARNGVRIERGALPRVFGVFFNQNQNRLFSDLSVRRALNLAAPRERIVRDVLIGYAHATKRPVPPTLGAEISTSTDANDIDEARKILEAGGWILKPTTKTLAKKDGKKMADLSFTLVTENTPELSRVGEIVKDAWESLGSKVELKTYEPGDLLQNILRPRKFDAVIYGEVVGHENDLFAFWHSSQRSDPGLNIASYANPSVDSLLEKRAGWGKIASAIEKDVPAVFLYNPEFVALVPNKLGGVSYGSIITQSDRFSGVSRWYVKTDKIWRIFADL